MDERRIRLIRLGSVTPTLDEKLLILEAINDVRRSRPFLEYDELWGARAAKACACCTFRRALATAGLTAAAASSSLGVPVSCILDWRSGRTTPPPEVLARLSQSKIAPFVRTERAS